MPNYFDYNKNNGYPIQRNPQKKSYYTASEVNRDRRVKSSEDLIIDDNSVYEIDTECFEKLKQLRLNGRQDWNRR
ncbi:MAG: hypothetical protein ACFWTJ_04510 [Lachnoclostridium sp.]|jgi:hypothetical protein